MSLFIEKISYSKTETEVLKLDIYLPEQRNGCPFLIWIHGGDWRGYDWMRGSRYPCPISWLAEHGYAVISIDYRTTTEKPFPSQLHHCENALDWVEAHAGTYCIDSKKGALVGFSGGATLALLVGLKKRKSIQAIVGFASFTILVNMDSNDTPESYRYELETFFPGNRASTEYLFGGPSYKNRKSALKATPELYITRNSPAVLLVHGADDQLLTINQSVRLYKQIKRNKGEATLVLLSGVAHGLNTVSLTKDTVLYFLNDKLIRKDKKYRSIKNRIVCQQQNGNRSIHKQFLGEENLSRIWFSSIGGWHDPIQGGIAPGTAKKSFFSRACRREVEYVIYLPPSYKSDCNRRYPVLYYLTPHVISPRQYSHNVCGPRNAAIIAEQVPEMIIVMPYHRYYEQRKIDSKKESISDKVIAEDLISHIDVEYRTISDAENRGIEGECDAGRLALALAFRFPELFGIVSATTPVFDTAVCQLLTKNLTALRKNYIRIEVGEDDPYPNALNGVLKYREVFYSNEIKHNYKQVAGGGHSSLDIALCDPDIAFSYYQDAFSRNVERMDVLQPMDHRRNLIYDTEHRLRLDLFLPSSRNNRCPLIVWIPGSDWRGSFLRNSINKEDCPLKYLVDSGFAIASLEYRLSDRAKFPNQIQDIERALDWLVENSQKFDLDCQKIGIAGFSVGALLASQFVLKRANNENNKDSRGIDDGRYKIKGVLFVSGIFDFQTIDEMRWRSVCGIGHLYMVEGSPATEIMEGQCPSGFSYPDDANGVEKDCDNVPDYMLIHGEKDTVIPAEQSTFLYNYLKKKGVNVQYEILTDAGHSMESLNAWNLIHGFFKSKLSTESEKQPSQEVHDFEIDRGRGASKAVGGISCKIFQSRIMNRPIELLIALPTCYHDDENTRFPVIYFLNDKGVCSNDHLYAFMYEIATRSDAATEAIIVLINGDKSNCFSRSNKCVDFGKMLVSELIPWIDLNYKTHICCSLRAMQGIGKGGSILGRIAFSFPEMFGALSIVGSEFWEDMSGADNLLSYYEENRQRIDEHMAIQLIQVSNEDKKRYSCENPKSDLESCYGRIDWKIIESASENLLLSYLEGDLDPFAFFKMRFR